MNDKIIEAIQDLLKSMNRDLLILIYRLILSIRERT